MVTTKLYGGTSGVARACRFLITCTAEPTLRGNAGRSVGLWDVGLVSGVTSKVTTTIHGGTGLSRPERKSPERPILTAAPSVSLPSSHAQPPSCFFSPYPAL